jgi:hypothetical protein
MIYGLGKYAENNNLATDDNPATQFQLEQAAQHIEQTDNSDPLDDLFGNEDGRALKTVF